ncbi:hypothetical protein LIN78_16430 [Leeia sp. TBRC 13508]|uniref:Uncharacterized protein n=1 Tax=Leeia speluncae TaxID=2884804 RepID=A0ABS8DA96_9NEIS|nr:hypothetical protein [Leeia speluncae]MCB6185136.1 hypothetical protein [Leeia speluncae]
MWFFDWVAGLFGIARGELFIYLGLGLFGLSFLNGDSDDWEDEGNSVDKAVDRQNFEQNNYYK